MLDTPVLPCRASVTPTFDALSKLDRHESRDHDSSVALSLLRTRTGPGTPQGTQHAPKLH